ncbi:hypothetical protein H257_05738 [Aphanomyces astaci]|uniref:NADP-dependent oxidoreductase domain-containing protein n=1 Tax=Aphanomyces astaci TaxID=112090 RepID=W4GQ72_APHAT|nr:hypothetical protein H257_05738 [Aphanomyces astaci]ETV81149.1 hypothetical protein H257_05738 [Aphanomyces astaci]|eukprot:XP_009829007.1 hypothetical protein H257_05738 [Aphanomyces astaci]
MWAYSFSGRRSLFRDRHRVLFSLSSNDDDRRNLTTALGLGAYGVFITAPDDASQLAAAKTALRDLMSKDSHITRDDICIVCECSSTWSLATLGGKCKDVAAKLDVGRIDVVLYPNALLSPAVHGQVRTVALVEAWTAMTTLRSAGLVDHIGVSDFAVHELEILLRRFPEHPVEVQCIRDVSPFSPYDHMVRFCQGKQIDVVACFSVQLDSLTHIQKATWSKIASDIATAHQRMHFQHNLPSETIRVDNSNASINQATETCDVQLDARRTASEVLATWLNQRGMIAVPMVEGDEPYDEGACRALFSLSHPFVKEPAAAAPSKPYHFVLCKDDMTLLGRLATSIIQ